MEKKDIRFMMSIITIIVITICITICVVVLNIKQTKELPVDNPQNLPKEEEKISPVAKEVTLDELKAMFPTTSDADAKETQKVEMISCEENGGNKCENYYSEITYNGYSIRLDHEGSSDINDYTITKGDIKHKINNAITLFEVNGQSESVGHPIVKDGKFYFLAFKDPKENEFYNYEDNQHPYLYYSYIDLKQETIKVVDMAKIKSTTSNWLTYNAISLED